MADITLNILKPSVNNLSARIFVRAAGLDFEEKDVWGLSTGPDYIAKYPPHLTPSIEAAGLPRGILGESCAIMSYLCNVHGLDRFYPADPAERAMVDNAMFYLIGTVYPLVARATYPDARLPPVRGRGRHLGGLRRAQGAGPARRDRRARRAARGLQHVLPRGQALHRRRAARRSPTSGWPRRSSSCARSTTTSRPGPRSSWRRWSRRWARPTRSRRPTCAGSWRA